MLGVALAATANPTGMTVHGGSATATSSGSQLTVTTTSQSAFLNWQSFNIAAGETTIFHEPSPTSIVWNQINNANPSQIYGSLQANGIVVLLNSSGFYFGPNSFVSAAGLVVSTANCVPPQNSSGSWEFNGPPPLASIVNYGQIKIGNGGSVFLIADKVENHGSIEAPGGTVGLAAGQTVLLSDRPDGRGMSMQVTLPSGSVDNEGRLIADGGTIAMNAKVVNQNGFIQANSVRERNGVIELVASDQLNLGPDSQILACGDDSTPGSSGGSVTLKSGNTFSDEVGSEIVTTGGAQGGNGGDVEISAPNVWSLNSGIDARAQAGWTAGKLLLDPGYIILDTSGSGSAGSGTVLAGNNPGSTLDLNVNSAFANLAVSQIILQALYDITLAGGTSWDLSGTIGANFGGVTSGQLTLEAGRNIIFGDGSSISDANGWSVTLMAGVNNFNTGTIQPGAGNIYLNGGNGQTGSGSVQTASGSINLEAGNGIQIGSGTVSSSAGNITWQAGGDIQFGDGSQITDGNNGLVTLDAGYNFANNTVQFGVGNIYLNGGLAGDGVGGSIQAAEGDITLVAGQDIMVGSGYVITTGGGSISAHALAGNIDTGSDAQGYHFNRNASSLSAAYNLQDGLGGISTAAGGDVTLIAGGNVTSVLPGKGVYYYDGNQETPDNGSDYTTAGSGAYGSQPGNVTIVAGGNVTGHYLVANGIGSIFAGVQMDANGNPIKDSSGNYVLGTSGSAGTDQLNPNLALSLVSGGWNVTAAQNIILQEVRNPNGVFDINGGPAYNHYFNYAAGDYVNLNAGNLVQLGASSSLLPRLTGITVPIIYPSILNVMAGAGGVVLTGDSTFNQLILFPSPQGSLTITTTDGGSLVSNLPFIQGAPQIFNLIVSDSGSSQYKSSTSFGLSDHAASPIHLDASTPIVLNIAGDMDLVFLDAPEAAQITVGGNMNNCGFQGMNLSANDVTSINVTGDIYNRSAFTSVTLDLNQTGVQEPDLSVFAQAVNNAIGSTSISAATLNTSLYYNPATQVLTCQNIPGVTLASVLQLLQNLTVQVYLNGVPQWTDSSDTIPLTTTVSVLTPATAQALLAQYNALGATPYNAGSYGYTIGGGGQFDITARTIDLGTSAGIQSEGAGLYTVRGSYPLASLFGTGEVFEHGADIAITTTGNHSAGETATGDLIGDLDMYSSSIASLAGGNISIFAGGDVNAGSADFSVNTLSARGIYSTSGGNVSVYAGGNINVNGSRIATYDGGNVTVESLNGDVNAGNGGTGFVGVQQYNVNPDTHAVIAESATIPGSGILTTTFLDSQNVVGNILVVTPNGNIIASAGGIVQLPVNGADASAATIVLFAGKQPILDTSATGNDVVQLYIYDATTGTWELEKGALQIISVYNTKAKKNENQIEDEPVLSGQNIVTLGPTIQVLEAGTSTPVSLTQVLDASGHPLLDANGNPLYVKTADASRQIVEYIQGKITPYLDAGGDPVNVSVPLDANGNPISNSQGNTILVMGRNIDANDSGVIGREIYLDATGNITGVFVGHDVSLNSLQNVTATVLASGTATVNAVGDITGEFIGIQGITADGGSGDPTLLSQNVNDGGLTPTQTGFAPGTTANATSQGMASDNSASLAKNADTTATDDDEKKKGKQAVLVQKTGRVTVLLPPKHLSQNQNSNNNL
jgi:filamentous hemagglutinin family protein